MAKCDIAARIYFLIGDLRIFEYDKLFMLSIKSIFKYRWIYVKFNVIWIWKKVYPLYLKRGLPVVRYLLENSNKLSYSKTLGTKKWHGNRKVSESIENVYPSAKYLTYTWNDVFLKYSNKLQIFFTRSQWSFLIRENQRSHKNWHFLRSHNEKRFVFIYF